MSFFFFFFNDTATTEIYTLSLHDALPICSASARGSRLNVWNTNPISLLRMRASSSSLRSLTFWPFSQYRSEEHTSELQSPCNLVCRLLLEKKKNSQTIISASLTMHNRPTS